MTGKARQLPLALPHNSLFDAEDLVITASNEAVFHLIEQWPQWPLPVALMIGPEGAGKSHFSTVWAEKSSAYHVSSDRLHLAVEKAQQGQPILLEDIGEGIDETGLFHLINAVRQAQNINPQATLLMSALKPPTQWNLTLADLISRLKSVTFVKIEQPDDALLQAVVFKLFADRQLAVELAVVNYIVSRMERSLSSARALVAEIDRLALEQKAKITKTLAADVMARFSA